jgi:WD40 repeat protein
MRSLVFSNSNNYLAFGGDEGVLYVLSVPSRSMILNTTLSSPIQSIAFSTRDERLSIGMIDGLLSLLCPNADWEPVGEIDHNESSITCQDWTSKTLAVGRRDGSVALFDVEKALCNFFVPVAEFTTSSLSVRSVAFSVGGRFVAIGGDNGVVSVLSAKGGWILCNQINMKCNVLTIRWSPAGRYVAFAGSDRVLCVHDTITWVALNEVKDTHSSIFINKVDSVSSIDWSVDSKWVSIGASGSGLHVMSTSTWKLLEPSANGLNSDGSDE